MQILKSHTRDLGGGLQVSRGLPCHPPQMVGPFIFFDQMGPLDVAPDWMTAGRGIVHSERGAPQSRMFHLAAELQPGAVLTLPAEHAERGIYLVQGAVSVDGTPLAERNLAFVSHDEKIEVRAGTQSRVMLLGGDKMAERRYIWWNLVASSKDLIEEAKRRWREQRFPAVPGEQEFIPLPEH